MGKIVFALIAAAWVVAALYIFHGLILGLKKDIKQEKS
jgi:hypothetical protein